MVASVKCPATAGMPVSQRKNSPWGVQNGANGTLVPAGNPKLPVPGPVKSTVPEVAKNEGVPGGRPKLPVAMCQLWMSWLM